MHRIHVIDSHTGGEPTRVVVAGGPDLGRGPMAERRSIFRERFDAFRSAVVNEPRGSDVLVGALLCEPVDPGCVAGVIFFNNVGYLGMCGHGTIGVAVTLAHLGRIGVGHAPPRNAGRRRLASSTTAAARSRSRTCPAIACGRRMSPSQVPGVGAVTGDVAWGGNWFFLVGDHGQELDLSNVDAPDRFHLAHSAGADAAGHHRQMAAAEIDHIELFGPPRNPASRRPQLRALSRQGLRPLALRHRHQRQARLPGRRRQAAPGQVWRQESIIGSVFEGSVPPRGDRVIPRITGSAYVTAEATLLLDPATRSAWESAHEPPTATSSSSAAASSAPPARTTSHSPAAASRSSTRASSAHGCSHANCGYVCPSHVLPLAAPGAVGMALRSLLRRDSPFYDQAALRPDPVGLAVPFRPPLQPPRHDGRGPRHPGVAEFVAPLYDELMRSADIDCEWEARGLLFVFQTAPYMDHYAKTDQLLLRDVRPGGDALRRRGADGPGAGAEARPGRRLALPDRRALATRPADGRVAARAGSAWRRRSASSCEVNGFVRERGRATAVVTDCGDMPADAFVVAAGALDAAVGRAPRLPGADPAGQGLLDHDGPARTLSHHSHDLRGTPRRRYAVAVGLPPRLDDGVRRLRHDAEPAPGSPAAARCRAITCTSRWANRFTRSGTAGGR